MTKCSTAKIQFSQGYHGHGHSKPRGIRFCADKCRSHHSATLLCFTFVGRRGNEVCETWEHDPYYDIYISVSTYKNWMGRQNRGVVWQAHVTFTNKNTELIDLILGLPAISLYNKTNKVDVQLISNWNFYCTSKDFIFNSHGSGPRQRRCCVKSDLMKHIKEIERLSIQSRSDTVILTLCELTVTFTTVTFIGNILKSVTNQNKLLSWVSLNEQKP